MPKRMRVAVSGLKRYGSFFASAAFAAAAWRSGVRLSRIQKPRPCVPAIKSAQPHFASSFTCRSRTEIAGMLWRSDCQ